MKKLTIIFYLFLIPLCVFAQNESSISHTKTVNDSTLIKIHAIVEDIDFRMHGLDRYKLYPTENIYNLKSATKPLNVLIAFTRPLITEFADNLNLKHPLLPTISPYPTM